MLRTMQVRQSVIAVDARDIRASIASVLFVTCVPEERRVRTEGVRDAVDAGRGLIANEVEGREMGKKGFLIGCSRSKVRVSVHAWLSG